MDHSPLPSSARNPRPGDLVAPVAAGRDSIGLDVLDLDAAEPTRADLLARVASLEGRLLSSVAIEQAKGALMLAYGLTADAAFALLRFHSQHRNVKIRAIAAQLTGLMASSPSSVEAMGRFNRLLDRVAQDLTVPPDSATTPVSRATLLSGPAARELPEVAVMAVAVAPPGITIAGNSPDHPLVYTNDAFVETTGYATGEVLGRNCRFLQGPDTDPKGIAQLSQGLQQGRDVSVVLQNYRSDGSPFLNEVSVSPIRNQDGQITHFVGTQIDITDRPRRPAGAGG